MLLGYVSNLNKSLQFFHDSLALIWIRHLSLEDLSAVIKVKKSQKQMQITLSLFLLKNERKYLKKSGKYFHSDLGKNGKVKISRYKFVSEIFWPLAEGE